MKPSHVLVVAGALEVLAVLLLLPFILASLPGLALYRASEELHSLAYRMKGGR